MLVVLSAAVTVGVGSADDVCEAAGGMRAAIRFGGMFEPVGTVTGIARAAGTSVLATTSVRGEGVDAFATGRSRCGFIAGAGFVSAADAVLEWGGRTSAILAAGAGFATAPLEVAAPGTAAIAALDL